VKILVTGGSGFIGTNLVEALRVRGADILNLDRTEPLCARHNRYWRQCDILDASGLKQRLNEFEPTHVVHLAARTDCDPQATLADYEVNTRGTENLLAAVSRTPAVERLLITSTQFVCGPAHWPAGDTDYAPHTVYGESKVITEQLTRAAGLDTVWTITRPTTIWGPWLLRHRDQFFRVLKRGLYLHPGRRPCIRSWGYVGNAVEQMLALLQRPAASVHEKTFYIGDPPRDLYDWVNTVSRQLRGRDVRVVPRCLLRIAALAGDAAAAAGLQCPINSSRYRSMTQDYIADLQPTFELLGPPAYTLEEGVAETLRWLHAPHSWSLTSATPARPAAAVTAGSPLG